MISSIDYNSDLAFKFKKTDGHSERSSEWFLTVTIRSDRRHWDAPAEPECNPFFQAEIFNP
jgi:hypothetical protein